ncbi:MAG: hypothetical protein ACFE9S_15275 [Candidatus Hermodarchaeota archaeon]
MVLSNRKSKDGESKEKKRELFKFIEECELFINFFLGKNRGKAFTANILKKKTEIIVQNPELMEYLSKNINEILERMVKKDFADRIEKNGDVFYFL